MSRLVFVTQLVDDEDPVLGSVTRWIRALADRFEEVLVIANRTGVVSPDVGATVISLDDPSGRGRLRRGLRYQRRLVSACLRHDADALLAHMCPTYLNQAFPITALARVPRLLWFAHPSAGLSLRAAARLSDVVLTSLPGAFPQEAKVRARVIGQATDVSRFALRPMPRTDGQLRLLALGRTSPSKGFATIIRAVDRLVAAGHSVTLRIVGPSTTVEERRHRQELEVLITDGSLQHCVTLEPAVSHLAVPELLASAHILVNAMVGGSGDKVVFEAMATGRPVVVSNPAMRELLEGLPVPLTFAPNDDHGLAGRLETLAEMSLERLGVVGGQLRDRVVRDHSLDHWADQVSMVVAELAAPSRVRSGGPD